MSTLLIVAGVLLLLGLTYAGRGYAAWVAAGAALVAALGVAAGGIGPGLGVAIVVLVLAAAVFGLPAIRRPLISAALLRAARQRLPRIGETERAALEAGTVWWDGALFSGAPDWRRLLDFPVPDLSEKEQAFLAGPVAEFCTRIDDWEITADRGLSEDAWTFLKDHGFFGMIIPEEYGGLGFSAQAHSAVVTRISSRSIAAAVVVMVPNSLGPGELLVHYGTDEQKRHFLPRLARGEEIPCFALTEPTAGSDAASGRSRGVVCRGRYRGEDVLGLRLTFDKRYITLAPVATVIGLAFRLEDPEGLLGGGVDRGITCALLPRDLEGLEIGEHHDPMGVPFPNGPVRGRDVFVPLDAVIGGRDGIGQGWRMLMETLAAGRSISLPALSVGGVELALRATGAYATVREQFGLPIGRFEGIEDPLARIAGHAYLMDAARRVTCAAVDSGERPAVVSAIVKAYLTEGLRACLADGMDIMAGAAICRGPRNILGRAFVGVPIAITVEGANILTRSMIVFGQGAIRCHPFAQAEIAAAAAGDVVGFDRAAFRHLNHLCRNAVRAPALALGARFLVPAPTSEPAARHLRALTRYSAAFALLPDVALLRFGGGLKRRERLTGRLADVLAWLYLASCAVKRFHDEGARPEDAAVLDWACGHAFERIETSLAGILANLPGAPMRLLLRLAVLPAGRRALPPGDRVNAAVARAVLDEGDLRRRLTADVFVPPADTPGLGRLEAALEKVLAAAAPRRKVADALRAGRLDREPADCLPDRAAEAGLISAAECDALRAAEAARDEVIQVDAFDPEAYRGLRP